MNTRTLIAAFLFAPLISIAAEESVEPVSQSPYSGFISRVQEALHAHGFDAGPVNGDLGQKMQAALAQFQLSQVIPAGGQLDDQTLSALGISRDAEAGSGT